MPIHEYRCPCGTRFEHLLRRADAPDPACPSCGSAPHRIPSAAALSGQADPGLSREQMPQTWRGTHRGDRDYVTHLRRRWERRSELEQRHPELAGDTRPVHAHEGRFHGAPLRSGDPLPGGHEHGHGHGHGSPARGTSR